MIVVRTTEETRCAATNSSDEMVCTYLRCTAGVNTGKFDIKVGATLVIRHVRAAEYLQADRRIIT